MNFIIRRGLLFSIEDVFLKTGISDAIKKDFSGLIPQTIVRAMKLVIILLIAACLQVSATGNAQTVTFVGKDVPLKKVFDVIHVQTGYGLFASADILAQANNVTVSFQETNVETAVKFCLEQQKVGLEYYWVGKGIVIRRKSPSDNTVQFDTAGNSMNVIARGIVYNEAGQPISGANITEKKTGRGTITNAKGEYELINVPVNSILTVTYVGYAQQQVKVSGASMSQIYLVIAKNELDKVVVQAYGITTQRLNTGNIGTVSADQIERQPVMNPLAALQGQVPGLEVTQTSGYASAPFKVEIRGRSVIDNGQPSEPLYIIDGVPLTVLNLNGNGNYATGSTGFVQSIGGPAGGQSPFFSINPNDIESISILKDADATAIYGSRGANGVVVITTKSGTSGKNSFDVNVYHGISEVTNRYHLLNTSQYLSMRKEAFKNDGIDMDDYNAYDILLWDSTKATNWQDFLWGKVGRTTDVESSLSGGDKQNVFRISSSFHNETSILSRSGSDQRISFQANYSHKSINQRLSFNLTNSYSNTHSDLIYIGGSVLEAPNAPDIFNQNGYLNWQGWQPVAYQLDNYSSILQPYKSNTGLLNSQLKIQYELVKGLSIGTQFGYSSMHNSQSRTYPIVSQNPEENPAGKAQFGNTNLSNIIVEPQIEYKTNLFGGKVNAFLGSSYQKTQSDANFVNGTGYVNDNLLGSISNAPTKSATDGFGEYKYFAGFFRVSCNWQNTYLINISARRDGSSRFGPGNQYGNFGAIGAAWIFSELPFFKEKHSFLSFGKIRFSYGVTGNDLIGDYGYLSRWSASNGLPYQGIQDYIPIQHANQGLEWETNKKMEIGLDIGFFHDRLLLNTSWYRNVCGNQLVQEPLPIQTGFNTITTNSQAKVENTGLEIILKAKIIERKNFAWSASFNIGINRNRLLSYPGLSQSPYAFSYVVGQPLNIVKLLHYTGVDSLTGQYTFEDKNHDGRITTTPNGPNDYYNFNISTRFSGGFETNFDIGNFNIDAFFVFKKNEIPSSLIATYPGTIEYNQTTDVLGRWQKPGDKANIARFTTQPVRSDIYFSRSDGAYSNGSYVRLRNLSVGYVLKSKWLPKNGIKNCKLYLRGQNVFVITRYNGLDPEAPGVGTMPPSKIFTAGVQFTL